MTFIRRKVFMSHYRGDRDEVDRFINNFSEVFVPKFLGANDNDVFISSSNTDYVMQKIREKYLGDSAVTIVPLGSCTHSRRYVDWEIKSSLQKGKCLPNGLMGIVLPSRNNTAHLPERLRNNWRQDHQDCYGRYWSYPSSQQQLLGWVEDAQQARTTRSRFINNSLERMKYNAKCSICEETH